MDYLRNLERLLLLQREIRDIHPSLESPFPVAIAKEKHFLIFDIDKEGKYMFIKEEPSPVPLPEKLRAAFPLECYGNKAVCVITEDAFESLEGYAEIFHEFVHCYQWETCEPELRQNLEVERSEAAKGNYMWELNYPFPYSDAGFEEVYFQFLESLNTGNPKEVFEVRERLKEILSREEFEYMVWQEWKEGFARFIENRIRRRFGLKEKHNGLEKPLSRVLFYEGGARFVEFLWRRGVLDLKEMFYAMFGGEM